MKRIAFGLILVLAVSFNPLAAIAVPKAGSACAKQGLTKSYQGKKFTCIKSGKKLVWNKGVAEKRAATVSTPTPTPTSAPSPTTSPITVSNLSEYRASEECKLRTNLSGTAEINQSHATRDFLKPDLTKTLRGLVFPVDFPDLQSTRSDAPSVLKRMTEDFAAFYSSQSNGKLKFEWTIVQKYTRLDKTISSFGVGRYNSFSNSQNYWMLNYAFQDLALKTYKRGDFDFFIAVSPEDTSEDLIATSPAFHTKDAKYWPGNWLGGDYWRDERKWFYPVHEFGHYVLGLDDLGSPASMAGISTTKPMGHYDLMNTQAGPELTSWNRWIGGLIEDTQILCLPNTTTVSLLKPIEEVNNEVKGLVIPLSNSKVLVIENRAAIGFDANMPSTSVGVIAYSVDVSVPRSQVPMRLVREPASPVDEWNQQRGGVVTPRIDALKGGESLTYSGYQVKVIGSSGKSMYVEVKKIN